MNAKKLLAQGVSPTTEKQRIKEQGKLNHFSDWLEVSTAYVNIFYK